MWQIIVIILLVVALVGLGLYMILVFGKQKYQKGINDGEQRTEDKYVQLGKDAEKIIADAEATSIDVNKSYVICYQNGNDYYMLKNDGSAEKITHGLQKTYGAGWRAAD